MPTDRDALALDLNTLAVEEQFHAEWRAGQQPRLSAYIQRYPEHAEALADLAASLAPDGQATSLSEMMPASTTLHTWAEAGEMRALAALFGAPIAESTGDDGLRVAEERGEYSTGQKQDTSTEPGGTDANG